MLRTSVSGETIALVALLSLVVVTAAVSSTSLSAVPADSTGVPISKVVVLTGAAVAAVASSAVFVAVSECSACGIADITDWCVLWQLVLVSASTEFAAEASVLVVSIVDTCMGRCSKSFQRSHFLLFLTWACVSWFSV